MMKSSTSATLLDRLRDGRDGLAWDEFFQRYWLLIYSYASRRGCSSHTAEEIVQDAFVRLQSTRTPVTNPAAPCARRR